MSKLILLSVLAALVTLPTLAARDSHPQRGLKRAVLLMVVFNFVYAFAVLVLVPRLGIG
ncbi:hypothetical protein P2318_34235 [Myxococcaceae bacterium GXIMD 01537]